MRICRVLCARKQLPISKKLGRRKSEREKRERAVRLLKGFNSPKSVSVETDVSLAAVYKIRRAMNDEDDEGLQKVLHPENTFLAAAEFFRTLKSISVFQKLQRQLKTGLQ